MKRRKGSEGPWDFRYEMVLLYAALDECRRAGEWQKDVKGIFKKSWMGFGNTKMHLPLLGIKQGSPILLVLLEENLSGIRVGEIAKRYISQGRPFPITCKS